MKAKSSEEVLIVYLNENRIGTLHRHKAGKLEFAYDPDYRGIPLSYSMPLIERIHGHDTITPFLWNLLPDDTRLLATWGRQFQVDSSNCFGLLREIGEDCAGAIRFVSPEEEKEAQHGGLTPITEKEIGRRLALLENDPSAARSLTDQGRFSLAGAQPKIALRQQNDNWYIPWGKEPTTHILKPPRSNFSGLAENEHFCLKLASSLGLRAAESTVQTFDGNKTFLVKRFDRMKRKEGLYRIHQEDMCQALGIGPERKYENDNGPGISDIMGILSSSSRRLEDRESFIDAIVFNYLILGTDAHAKNYSILHTRQGFILAPLYDIASFAPYIQTQKDERIAMRIDRYYKIAQIRKRHFERTAKSCNFSSKRLLQQLENFATQMPRICEEVGHSTIKEGLDSQFIESLVKSLTERSKQALDLLTEK